jgi:hypothetical protein
MTKILFVWPSCGQDPLIVARLLVVGRDCLLQTQYKVGCRTILGRAYKRSWAGRHHKSAWH